MKSSCITASPLTRNSLLIRWIRMHQIHMLETHSSSLHMQTNTYTPWVQIHTHPSVKANKCG
jgi:hypothetical protein